IERNQNQDTEKNVAIQNRQVEVFLENGLTVDGVLIMAAFGCNFAGDIPTAELLATVERAIEIAEAHQCTLKRVSLNDTMAWATPSTVKRTVGAIRERWPSLRINLHFHNTRGLGL